MATHSGLLMALQVPEIITQEKKVKVNDDFTTEVKKYICALFNDKGGNLRIEFSETFGEHLSDKVFTDFIRKIEQHVKEISDYRRVSQLGMTVRYPRYITLHVQPTSTQLCTINYNICLPTNIQIVNLSSTEPVESITNLLKRKDLPEDCIEKNSHHKRFVYKTRVSLELRECQTVQHKIVKAEATKCVSLADRITNKTNKLVNLVSAFANHKGGHLYIGIDSRTYEVEGLLVDRLEERKIRNKISKLLTKMIWPEHSGVAQKGKSIRTY